MATTDRALNWVEQGVVPDALIRAGIRRLSRARLAQLAGDQRAEDRAQAAHAHGDSGGGRPSYGYYEKSDMKAVADWALARSEGSPQRFYSMSAQIEAEKKRKQKWQKKKNQKKLKRKNGASI